MDKNELRELTNDFARLTEVIYSAGMDEEAEVLQEIWNKLIADKEEQELNIQQLQKERNEYNKSYEKALLAENENLA